MKTIIVPFHNFHIPSDVIEEILFFIQPDDGKTLHSCLLINRQWCQLVVPRLWKHPFYYARKGNSKLISMILTFLTDSQRENLIHNGIILSKKFQKTIFDYVSMLKHLHYDYLLISVEEWCKKLTRTSGISVTLTMKEILRLFVIKSVELKSLFICPNHVYWRYSLSRYMELVEPEFNGLIKNLKYFHVETHSQFPSANFFQKFSMIVHNVEKLHLKTPSLGLMGFPNGIEDNMAKSLCTFIQSQHKLKEFKLVNSIKYTTSFISSLSIHTNHLKNISLFDTKIDELKSWKILTSCFNLENLEIINCVGLRNDFILPFYNIVNLKKLKWVSLEKNQPSDINDELKFWVINGYKKGLSDCRFLKSEFDDINNVINNNNNNNNVILNKA